jgi:glycerol transport system ATP-binding protein
VDRLELRNVDHIVNNEVYLKGINLEFAAGSRNILLGRTLAGKTTLLRIIAGLDRPTKGSILEDGVDITGVSVRKRRVAMVYQQFINYPSLTVFDNIASPLKLARIPRDDIRRRVYDTAKTLHIDNLLDRYPAELSGGQQQRTAIARALIKDADLLLLDEPLVNLDYKLREELREELTSIFSSRQSVVIYTTTEPSEALMLGGNVIVLDEGGILQEGNTSEVFRSPSSVTVSQVFSDPPVNLIKGGLKEQTIHLGHQAFPATGQLKALEDGNYTFGIRPNHLFLKSQSVNDIRLAVTVELTEISGSESFIHTSFEELPLVIQEDGVHHRRLGEPLEVYINPENILVFHPSGDLVAAPLYSNHP